jgi:valyl-tRNA synthetase
METGGEILYPWVSRMIMMGLYMANDIPFKEVYIHGYVMAEDGSKMSKSVGNVVDPLPVLEKYGSDALRMGIIAGRSPAVNRGYDPRKVEEARNFANKLWNVARFIESQVGDDFAAKAQPQPETAADYYILYKLQQITEAIGHYLDDYRFSEAYDAIYHFVWDELADWYIEASKTALNKGVLAHVLEAALKLAHPFAPFVTETIWQTLKWEGDSLLAVAAWPEPAHITAKQAEDFEAIKTMVSEIRFIKSSLNLPKATLLYHASDFMADNAGVIASLARVETIETAKAGEGLQLTQAKQMAWLQLEEAVIQRFVDQLADQLKVQETAIKRLEDRLRNKSYVDNAPAKLVEETKAQLEAAKTLRDKAHQEYLSFKRT